ncbi:MAG: alpha/beta fold hydrolase [Bacteroidetes bacterium]|nr:alpha/beta fold hydrolase [Bacteroidota bacterium]
MMETKTWLNRKEYPFKSNFFETGIGKMHYIDEGEGDPILFIHGNPTWSFTYRKIIKVLSVKYRCIAVDLIGFGLSDKPFNWYYKPEHHAKYIAAFIDQMNLKNLTLVVNDWGGPIGLSYAVNNPDNIKSLVLFNTWMWSVKGYGYYERFSGFMGGKLGRFLIKYFNFFGRSVVPMATGNKANFPKEMQYHYFAHLETKQDRKGSWVFPKEIINSSDWLDSLWQKRQAIKKTPVLLLWGLKDIAFRKDILKKWEDFFDCSESHEYLDAGHYPQEEKGNDAAERIFSFLHSI